MRRLLPLLLLPLTACTLSSDPAADSVGKAEKAAHGTGEAPEGRVLMPIDPAAPTLRFDAPASKVVFEPDKGTAKAGVVNIRFTTDGAHNWTLDGPEA